MDRCDVDLVRCLRVFERCRISYGHSVESIFRAVNLLDTATVPVGLLAENLHLYLDIKDNDANKLADIFDFRKRKEVALGDVQCILEKYKSAISMESLINEHPFFPIWLTNREDFREFFTDWTTENGAPNVTIVEMALRNKERKPGDLQLIFKWIKIHKILSNVKDSRLLEVCKSFEYLEVRQNLNVVTQGDHGDAFYIILEGTCTVLINDKAVGTMSAGMSFGEKALENDAPRAATIKTLETCKLMVLRSSEYKSLVASAQAKMYLETVEFIHAHCDLFSGVSYARLFHMVKKMVRKVFQEGEKVQVQGEDATCLFIIVSGKVDISRKLRPADYEILGKSGMRMQERQAGSTNDVIDQLRRSRENLHVDVKVRSIRAGGIFGDDTIRRSRVLHGKHTYNATAVATTEIIIVNKEEALSYFNGKLLSLQKLYSMTNRFHASGSALLEKHRLQASKEEKMANLKDTALRGKYHDRVHEKARQTRSISTQALLSHQAHSDRVRAHTKYTEKLLEHMNAPLDRKKIRRRSSLITFLAAKSPQSHVELPVPKKADEGQDRGHLSHPQQDHRKRHIATKVPSFGS